MTTRRGNIKHTDDPVAVGRRLRKAREKAGLSQRQLAMSGCSAGYLSRIEAGERTPSLQLLRELARRVGVTEEYLAYGTKGRQDAQERLREAEVALRMDDRERARELFEAEATADDEQGQAAALEGLGQLAYREGESREAVDLFEQAMKLYGDKAIERRSLVDTLGRAYAGLGELDEAIGLYERALTRAEERKDVLDQVRLGVLLSYALSDTGQLGRAEAVLGRSLAHAEELADQQARVSLYWAQCRLHILEGRPDLAERYGQKVIDLLEMTEDSFYLARAFRLMAHIELDRHRPEEALELLARSREVVGESGNEIEEGMTALNEARAYAQLGELERAASLAMSVAGTLAERPGEAGQSYTILGKTFAQAGDRARAIELLELAAEMLEQAPNRFLIDAYAQLAELLEAEGKKDEAFEVMRKALKAQSEVSEVRDPAKD